jgi:hypothetical protein
MYLLRIVRWIRFLSGDSISGAKGRSSDPAMDTVWVDQAVQSDPCDFMSGHKLPEHRIDELER